MRLKKLIFVSVLISLSSCSGGPKQTGGTIIGGATGAVVGSQFGKGKGQLAGVAIGTMLGAYIGSEIGKSMDDRDRQLAGQSTYNALEYQPDNSPVRWSNPNNNHYGQAQVIGTQESGNKVCRDYVQTVSIDGEQQKVYGRACRDVRDAQGQWVVQ